MFCCLQSCRIAACFANSFHRTFSSDVRVRFAPSPTGRLHLGGLRTALYNFLYARANNGKFIVRIEDTDQTRIVEGAMEEIENDLLWAGMQPHESPAQGGAYGPYIQSQRLKYYRENTEHLIENGTAYRCFCSDKRLELLRRDAVRRGVTPRYDNQCRNLHPDEIRKKVDGGKPYCVRFKLEAGPDSFEDMVYGKIVLDTASVEGDPVILKSDGFPTYHLACVVDDHLMEISHVLRGVEWQISTSKHLQLYRAFEWKPPQFGHLPLLMNPNGTKLSKRQGDIDVKHFRKLGVYPEVLLSFVTEFGGGFLREQCKPCVYRMDDLIKQFNFGSLNTSSCKVDLEKLTRLNRMEIDRMLQDPKCLNALCDQLRSIVMQKFSEELSPSSPILSDERLVHLLKWGLPRMSCIEDFLGPDLSYIWAKPSLGLLLNITKDTPAKFVDVFETASHHLQNMSNEGKSNFIVAVKDRCHSVDVGYGTAMKALRAALSGLKSGPPVHELIETLGPDEAALRFQVAIEKLRPRQSSPEE